MAYWDDEMEVGNTGYPDMFTLDTCGGLSSGNDTVNKISGNGSLRLGYPGAQVQVCGGFADRSFPATLDLWSRFYMRLSPGFIVDTTTTKIMLHATDSFLSNWWIMAFSSSKLVCTAQLYPPTDSTNFFCNLGTSAQQELRTSPEGGWRMVETRERLGAADSAEGLIEAWIGDAGGTMVKVMSHSLNNWRNTTQGSQNSKFVWNRMFRQSGEGNINYDRVAMGDARIGPITGGLPPLPPPPPTVPTQPTGLQVT